jgi:hypothetical protein
LEQERRYQLKLAARQEARASGRRFITSGAITLGVSYLVACTIGGILVSDANQDAGAYWFVPIVGSPIYLAWFLERERDRQARDEYYDDTSDDPLFLISLSILLPAIAQTTGLTLLAVGLAKRSRYKKQKQRPMALAPIITPESKGFSFVVAF